MKRICSSTYRAKHATLTSWFEGTQHVLENLAWPVAHGNVHHHHCTYTNETQKVNNCSAALQQ